MSGRRAKDGGGRATGAAPVRRASIRGSVTRISALDLLLLAAQVIGLAVAAVGALAQLPWLVLLGVLLSLGSQVAITLLRSSINRALSYIGISRAIRVLLLVLLSVFLQLALSASPAAAGLREEPTLWLLPLAGALCFVATFADQWRAQGYRVGGLAWRGFESVGLEDSAEAPRGAANAIVALVPVMILGGGVGTLLGARGTRSELVVVAGASVIVAVGSILASAIQRVALRRRGRRADRLLRLREALDAYAPEAVIFFSAPASATYALNVWMQTANRFSTRTVIISKEAAHLANVEPTRLPIILAARATDVDYLTVRSVKVVLHPTTANKVFEILRLRGLLHIFIGHGDSDKVSSYNPYSRVFDEIWVSGPAGVDRYAALGDGFRTEQFVTVGRPQLAEIATIAADVTPGASGTRPTVLYAPTWEGFLEQSNYSSLAAMGVAMITAILAMPNPPRILFKPHPSTGHRRADMLAAKDEIARLLLAAGSDHLVYDTGTVSLYAAFNQADTMITDISSVLTDFLASHKPYLVTNPRDEKLAGFLAEFPSSAAGSIIDTDLTSQQGSDFVTAIRRGLDGDPKGRPARTALADYLLGPLQDDPVQAFVDEVARSVERARQRYPDDREVPIPPDSAGNIGTQFATAGSGSHQNDGRGGA
jgi:CDP-Glycerol:Poly(glycerophosphate) glycerophosphotransferase